MLTLQEQNRLAELRTIKEIDKTQLEMDEVKGLERKEAEPAPTGSTIGSTYPANATVISAYPTPTVISTYPANGATGTGVIITQPAK